MEALQNGQATVEGGVEGQSAGAASHAMIEKILSEEPRWQGKGARRQAQGVGSPPSLQGGRAPSPLRPAKQPQDTAGEFPQTCLALLPSSRSAPGSQGLSHMRASACGLEPPTGTLSPCEVRSL